MTISVEYGKEVSDAVTFFPPKSVAECSQAHNVLTTIVMCNEAVACM